MAFSDKIVSSIVLRRIFFVPMKIRELTQLGAGEALDICNMPCEYPLLQI